MKFTSKLFGRALSRRIKATVLYATETGKSEQYAKQLVELLGHAFNAQVCHFIFSTFDQPTLFAPIPPLLFFFILYRLADWACIGWNTAMNADSTNFGQFRFTHLLIQCDFIVKIHLSKYAILSNKLLFIFSQIELFEL